MICIFICISEMLVSGLLCFEAIECFHREGAKPQNTAKKRFKLKKSFRVFFCGFCDFCERKGSRNNTENTENPTKSLAVTNDLT